MHWQVKVMQGSKKMDVYYYNPSDYQLELVNCKLVNRPSKANQVFEKGVHDVSGWVKCSEVILRKNVPVDNLEKLFYNPIRDPHWRRESDSNEFVWDNSEFTTLVTNGKQVYVLEERL
jgi:esterase/lipase superfamily enzyme